MAWHLLEKIVEHSAAHSTIFGKWWIAFMFVFRIIVVVSVGDSVYSDEQDEFVCNTRQPGCKQVCYNLFAPISHIRFWAFQILATGLPCMIFIIFATHKLAALPPIPQDETNSEPQTSDKEAAMRDRGRRTVDDEKKSQGSRSLNYSRRSTSRGLLADESSQPPDYVKVRRESKVKRVKLMVLKAYVVNVVTRCLIESGFLFLQIHLYKWTVPEFFECIRYPCPKIVECYISRPMEKTVFLYFMFSVSALCIAINVFELQYLGWKRLKRAFARKPSLSQVIRTFPLEMEPESKYGERSHSELDRARPTAPRIIHRYPLAAPPGYYIPDVDPPTEKYRSPANGFPPIRMRAASFTTSESDVTTDDTMSSMGSVRNIMEQNARVYL